MKLFFCIFVLLSSQLAEGWVDPNNRTDDQNVLTIFLPILGIAILACAGGCCYMERKRKERIKRGEADDDTSDAESIISTSTVRSRPYLLPSTTTGRISRTNSRAGSRAGSIRSYHSNYDQKIEKPPSYLSHHEGLQMNIPDEEISFYGETMHDLNRGGFDNPGMKRSTSMINVKSGRSSEDLGYGLRRSASVNDFHHDSERFGGRSRSQPPSPSGSQWSIRTAPQIHRRAPSSVSGRTMPPISSLKRSMSQPDLWQRNCNTRTYPQGILKRPDSACTDEMTRHYFDKTNISSDSGVKDLYGDHDGSKGYHFHDRFNEKMEQFDVDPYLSNRQNGSVAYGYGYGNYNDNNPMLQYQSRPSRHHAPVSHHHRHMQQLHPGQRPGYGTLPRYHHSPHYAMSDYGNYDPYSTQRNGMHRGYNKPIANHYYYSGRRY